MALQKLSHVTVFVQDQNDALHWYSDILSFEKQEDDAKAMPESLLFAVEPEKQREVVILPLPQCAKKANQVE
jgi:catechol 2,3-dioxygenase-like lactoylglutathione lyase family enzyme